MTTSFYVAGRAETKGSTQAFVVKPRHGGKARAVITNDNAKAKRWASVVSIAAMQAMKDRAIMEGPVRVVVRFDVARPKSHSTKKGLRPDAPVFVSSRPDVDKMLRCVLDALTGIVFLDDAQVAIVVGEKRYAGSPGAIISVEVAT